MIKRLIGAAAALVIAITSIGTMKTTAKVIQPEIVKTEKWTTSYWIDDNVDMKYPYVAVEADIYDDGHITVYWWNTHEWDGFANIYHMIYYGESPFFKNNDSYSESRLVYWKDNVSRAGFDLSNFHINSYPKEYNCSSNSYWSDGDSLIYNNIALPHMDFSETRLKSDYIIFTPTVEPTGTYTFQIFGHEIVITPDILNMDGYKIEEYHSNTAQYEAEIADLKIKNTTYVAQLAEYEATIDMYETLLTSVSLERGDVNNDGFINAVDASQILAYYAYTSTGGHLDFMDFLEGKADKEES